MKNVVITILTVLVVGLGCTLGYVLLNKGNNTNPNEQRKEVVEQEKEVTEQNIESNETKDEVKNSYAKLYRSEDNKYVLLLAEYEHSYLNTKAQNTIARDYYLTIDEVQSISYVVGHYSINENKLVLEDSNHKVETIYAPSLEKVLTKSAGTGYLNFEYSEDVISFDNIKLYLVK